MVFPARVGVWHKQRFILVGAGATFFEALQDAESRQKMLEERIPEECRDGDEHGPYCRVFVERSGKRVFCAELRGHKGNHDFQRRMS
jgi:hypothetical protein